MLFNINSALIIGASRDEGKVGNVILRNMKTSFKGNLYIVHPSADEILGIKCYKDIDLLPEIPDLAIISLPPAKTIETLEKLGKKGVKLAVAVSGGFGEKGEEGKLLEKRISEISKSTGIRVIGPNSVGLVIPGIGVNTALTDPSKTVFPKEGRISFISQSGALGLLNIDKYASDGLGFSSFISLGNSADIKEVDALDLLKGDESTKSFSLYLENISDMEKFLNISKEISKNKGLVVLKGGLSESGSRATNLHTGSLFKPSYSLKGIFRQHGIIMANNEEELIDASVAISYSKPLKGKNIAIITSAGGVGVIASDILEANGFKVPKIREEDAAKLQSYFSPLGSPYNPIDITAEATDDQYLNTMDYLDRLDYIDGVLVFTLFQTYNVTENLVLKIKDKIKNYSKPYVFGYIGGNFSREIYRNMLKNELPAFPNINRTVGALKVLFERGNYLRRFEK